MPRRKTYPASGWLLGSVSAADALCLFSVLLLSTVLRQRGFRFGDGQDGQGTNGSY